MTDRSNSYTFIPPNPSPGVITEDEEGDDPTSKFTYALYPVCDYFHECPEFYKIVAEMREKAYKEIEARAGCDYVWMMGRKDLWICMSIKSSGISEPVGQRKQEASRWTNSFTIHSWKMWFESRIMTKQPAGKNNS